MLVFPHIDPVAFSFGPVKVHWYGLMYLLAFIGAWGLAHLRVRLYKLQWTSEQIADLIFYGALGAVIGGRLGYMLFYNFKELLTQPWVLFKIWEGGMSFHGGLLGVFLALILFARQKKKNFWQVADFIAPLVPLGLGLGRIGNFINGELWGRVTNVPWAMVFPHVDGQPRHPSQIYEFTLEGVVLFMVVWWYASKPRPEGRVSAVFLIGYSLCRFLAEFFREPDAHIGYIAFGWLTMGQLLSIPMLIAGLLIWWIKR
ncbi:prolipoprotein diacylglyceryl transferase [Legionella israelensis]|uniref:Phosphatidylglycerol--prolipoprotein diacylglyceryl transferase n=1 Tax=Legionella israelensis TaxID=454 RepID=A0A0W0W6V1_9GAMM|nr:prolipoprotein diacylglyceryl transferase [Legionella israelensis]KTD27907.1 prolipoprotein diacylglyceryl transferase [Legionella israelensis]QBS11083.1 prolipoprotein diacylglyceryl transferase [Legionella israelensis]QDP73572.1 prolipoprotein diacylglyceryl transferase [Legionella israelensis]SCX95298.1 Prolipoprotein diacylglyceryl transferase [Legionella israelensis DSM 19235]STX60343.1 prolipoprotein diacylglyceryl transferase [Legionella israelensis]